MEFTRVINCESQDFLEFVKLYEQCFPEKDEREEITLFKSRLQGHETRFSWNLYVAKDNHQSQNVCGFIIFEYLYWSSCGLLTYIAVRDDYRRRGIAESLVNIMMEQLFSEAKAKCKELKAVFLEAEDPEKVKQLGINCVIDPEIRLRAFQGLFSDRCFQKVPFGYIQPALSEESSFVEFLSLYSVYPSKMWDVEAAAVALCFIYDLYCCCQVADPSSNQSFARMRDQLTACYPDLKAAKMHDLFFCV